MCVLGGALLYPRVHACVHMRVHTHTHTQFRKENKFDEFVANLGT